MFRAHHVATASLALAVALASSGTASAASLLGQTITGVIQIAGLAMGIAGATLLGKSRADAKRLAVGPGGLMVRF